MINYWITKDEFELCGVTPVQTIYRSYIYNFQEDMWKNIYKGTSETDILNSFFDILKENRNRFLDYCEKPTITKLNLHIIYLDTAMENLSNGVITDSIFDRSIGKVNDEFTIKEVVAEQS